LYRPSLVAKEQWLFHDSKKQAPFMHMILQPVELEEILNRGVLRMKLKAEAAEAAAFPSKAAVPAEKSGSISPGRGFNVLGAERYRLPPASTFKFNRGIVKDRTP